MTLAAQHLADADRHISEAERRITEQEARLWAMEAAGQDTAEGKRFLANLKFMLKELHVHRRLILAELDAS